MVRPSTGLSNSSSRSAIADKDEAGADHGYDRLAAVIPALNEEGSVGAVVSALRALGVGLILVADNGSTDQTAETARAAGAQVVNAVRRGYGSACLAALAAVPHDTRVVVFCDADGADDLSLLRRVVEPVLRKEADLVIGSRALGRSESGALTLPQRAGNWVASQLLGALFSETVTDLGPFRAISTDALERIGMSDPAFGWTAEMQTKALRLGLRVLEVPVNARARTAGASKISGRAIPVLRAGWAILTTILWYRVAPLPQQRVARRSSGEETQTCSR
ncbi:MAG: glycosyltransferase family 2 protein [Sandaracinaceae bacterium]|nr:glycosyltransferase family 2 protein [Sandaracinaceae bacterium]